MIGSTHCADTLRSALRGDFRSGSRGTWLRRFLKDTEDLVERGQLTLWMAQVDYVFLSGSAAAGPQLFVTGGVGAVRIVIDVLDAFTASSTQPAGQLGGGVLLPFHRHARLKSDVRYVRSTFEEGGRAAFDIRHVSFWRVTTGVIVE